MCLVQVSSPEVLFQVRVHRSQVQVPKNRTRSPSAGLEYYISATHLGKGRICFYCMQLCYLFRVISCTFYQIIQITQWLLCKFLKKMQIKALKLETRLFNLRCCLVHLQFWINMRDSSASYSFRTNGTLISITIYI